MYFPTRTLPIMLSLSKQAISLAEHTQREIENLDSLLQDRKHIKSQLQDLQQEQRDIEELRKQSKNKGKRLDDDKQSLLNELTKKVYVMDREASYLNFTSAQLDDVHYNVAIVMIQSAISKAQTDESRSEMKIASCVNDQDKVIEKQEANKNKSLNDQLLETVIDRCMGYVKHPEYVMKLLNMIAPNIGGELESENGEQQDDNDLKQVLKLGRRVVDECGICEQRAHAREIPEQTLLVLEKEQSDLEVLRKDLTAAQKTQIEELKQKMENDESMKLPSYLTVVNYDEISNWKFNALYKMMNTLLSLKRKSDKAIPDAETREESTAPFEALRQKYHEMLSNDVLNLVKIHLTNLTNLNQIITQLQNHKEYDLCVSLANHAHEAINKLRNEIADRVIPEQKYVLLEAESNKLLTQRKQLTVEQQDELRQLKINHALYELQPKYKTRQTDSSLDKLAYQYSHAMVVSALSERNETDLRVTNDSQMDSDVAQQESDSSVEKLESIVDQAVDHLSQSTCFGIENTIKILLHLNTQLQYPLVLRVGKVCQARIDRLRDLVITIFALEKEKLILVEQQERR
ncbi:hypothetical protein AKO1_010286 [Acrasis kona]|uniref:Uncharacterized protein n=1 Tax=Acrasis kona TaxID=1008807 RepID=A0AAW2ZNX0_9EUKA